MVYKPGGVAIWDSHTAGKPGGRLVLQNDANLVIYQAGPPSGLAAHQAEAGVGTPVA